MKKYAEFYDKLYNEKIDVKQLRSQKMTSPSKRMKRQMIIRSFKSLPFNSKILEIGCGMGDMIGPLKFKHKVGTDISKEAVKKAKMLFPDCNFVFGDANKRLEFNNGEFDGIILADVLEHIENDSTFLREVSRIVKKGGIVLIITPYTGKYENIELPDELNKEAFGIGGDLRDYGYNLVDKIKTLGFEIRKIRFVNGILGKIVWTLKERAFKKNKEKTTEKIMTGQFMNKNFLQRTAKLISSEILYRLYALNNLLFSSKNEPGIIFIEAQKNE